MKRFLIVLMSIFTIPHSFAANKDYLSVSRENVAYLYAAHKSESPEPSGESIMDVLHLGDYGNNESDRQKEERRIADEILRHRGIKRIKIGAKIKLPDYDNRQNAFVFDGLDYQYSLLNAFDNSVRPGVQRNVSYQVAIHVEKHRLLMNKSDADNYLKTYGPMVTAEFYAEISSSEEDSEPFQNLDLLSQSSNAEGQQINRRLKARLEKMVLRDPSGKEIQASGTSEK